MRNYKNGEKDIRCWYVYYEVIYGWLYVVVFENDKNNNGVFV